MSAIAFDTHAFVKELTAAGFSESQAEAVTSMVRRSREVELADLARKSDLAHLASKADLAEVKADLLKWMVGTIGFQTLVILGAIASLARWLPLPR